jgi:tRNA nucleotidyltransferase (CCA-adding enzyme)
VKRSHISDLGPRTTDLERTSPTRLPLGRLLRRPWGRVGRLAGEVGDELSAPVLLVGGCVRDLLLGRPVTDLDIMIEGDGRAAAERLAQRLGASCRYDRRFLTAALYLRDGKHVDVATTRTESYPRAGALPEVQAAPLTEDLRRRDFTINAMAVFLNSKRWGEVLDPFGGREDLRRRVLRVIHDGSFADDPIRALRGVRFESRLGFRMEARTERLARRTARQGRLATVGPDRLRDELILLLQEPRPHLALARAAHLGLLRAVHPRLRLSAGALRAIARLDRQIAWFARIAPGQTLTDWVVRLLVALAGLGPAARRSVGPRLNLSRRHSQALEAYARGERMVKSLDQPGVARSAIYRVLRGVPGEAVLALVATHPSRRLRQAVDLYFSELRALRPHITGKDLKALGFRPGPAFGDALHVVRDARLDGKVATRRDELILARRVLQ